MHFESLGVAKMGESPQKKHLTTHKQSKAQTHCTEFLRNTCYTFCCTNLQLCYLDRSANTAANFILPKGRVSVHDMNQKLVVTFRYVYRIDQVCIEKVSITIFRVNKYTLQRSVIHILEMLGTVVP